MAQNQSRPKAKSQGRQSQEETHDQDFDSQDSTGRSSTGQGRQSKSLRGTQGQDQSSDLLSSITPAFNEARAYIEGNPVRAAAIGAVAGGLIMSIFATEKGRAFVKLAYDYANPMVAKYAREYMGNLAENAISQH